VAAYPLTLGVKHQKRGGRASQGRGGGADDLRSVNAQIEIILRRALDDAGRGVRAAPLRGRGRPRKDSGESREEE